MDGPRESNVQRVSEEVLARIVGHSKEETQKIRVLVKGGELGNDYLTVSYFCGLAVHFLEFLCFGEIQILRSHVCR